MTRPPANWYPNPENDAEWRYWDGTQWTDHVAPRATAPTPVPTGVVAVAVTASEVVEVTAVDRVKDGASNLVGSFAQGLVKRREKRTLLVDKEPSIAKMLAGLQREAPQHPLDEQVEVAGETYHVKGIKKVFSDRGILISEKGTTLDELICTLVPEPWNPYDPNAVAVVVDQHQVGHLPAEFAADYAAPLGRRAVAGFLVTGEARIWAKSDGGMIRARVTLLIPEAPLL